MANQYHLLVSELNRVENRAGPIVEKKSPPETKAPPEPVVKPEKPVVSKPEAPAETIKVETQLVDVENMEISRSEQNHSISYRFRITNIHPKDELVSGYVFVLFENPKTDPPDIFTSPKVTLKDNQPSDYKRGHQFSIRHGKTVKDRVENVTDPKAFTMVRVLAYSDEGTPILNKSLGIPNENHTQ